MKDPMYGNKSGEGVTDPTGHIDYPITFLLSHTQNFKSIFSTTPKGGQETTFYTGHLLVNDTIFL